MVSQNTAFVFPGQGSQKAGMLSELGDEFPIVKSTFAQASEVLAYDLWDLIQNDANNELAKTHITQPAILTSSVAIWRVWLELNGGKPAIMAGHSLGEYSALVCSGVLNFDDAVTLVKTRGELMQSAVPEGVGSMAAIVGMDDTEVIGLCEQAAESEVVAAVNFNSPGQVVIAGHTAAVERAMALCKEAGAKRALLLPVSAPFHSVLMQPAAERFADALGSLELKQPEIPVLQNYGLQTSNDTSVIQDNLLKQIYSPVPWVKTIKLFYQQGIQSVFELGPGKVLTGLNRRIESQLTTCTINDKSSLEAALQE